jgi:Ca-activated chloride channel family protein
VSALAWLGFDLLRPQHAAWFAPVVLTVAVSLLALRWRRRERERLVYARHAARFLPQFSPRRAVARAVLASIALAFLAFAALGPVCIDTSRSMLVRDLRPDRLTRAKREVAGLIERMHGDRVALVAFSGDARDVAPLTHDRTTLKALLERVSPEENTKGGTDIGNALQHALQLFDGRTGSHEAIVMLTDGEDLEGRGLEVAKTAQERGIRIYVVGMATEGGGKIPLALEGGREAFTTDESGKEVVSELSDASLREIAATSGGEYVPAMSSPIPLEDLYERRINRLEGRELAGSLEYVPHDRFQWFLAVALACMVIEGALRERRRAPREEVAR